MADKKVYKVSHKFDLDQGETAISTSIQVQVSSENGDHAKEVAMQHMKKLAAFAVHGSHSITDDFDVKPSDVKEVGSDTDDSGADHEEENEQSAARDYWKSQDAPVMASQEVNNDKLVAESATMLEAKLHLMDQVSKRAETEEDVRKIGQELRYKYPTLSSEFRQEIVEQVVSEFFSTLKTMYHGNRAAHHSAKASKQREAMKTYASGIQGYAQRLVNLRKATEHEAKAKKHADKLNK